jgi:polyketide biosynthesis enoyl-CoA hydratase PksI
MREEPVTLQEIEPSIVQVTMQDRIMKNAFTLELSAGLIGAFQTIAANSSWKVVILTGYDNYFSSGGTQQALLTLHEGRATFADVNLYGLAMDCEIPVIAAMQGHAIGGGFVMGIYADFVIFGRESVYTTNFMKYGFTPGMGATYILAKKLGLPLAQEMLIMAETFRGESLERRGIPYPVLRRAQVLPRAIEMARSIVAKPRKSLVALKTHLVASMRAELPTVIETEIAMHNLTFHDAEIKERISTLFGK